MGLFDNKKDTKSIQIAIRVNEDENKAIEERVKELNLKNKTEYIRLLLSKDLKK